MIASARVAIAGNKFDQDWPSMVMLAPAKPATKQTSKLASASSAVSRRIRLQTINQFTARNAEVLWDTSASIVVVQSNRVESSFNQINIQKSDAIQATLLKYMYM